jgi:hypothetical protein
VTYLDKFEAEFGKIKISISSCGLLDKELGIDNIEIIPLNTAQSLTVAPLLW